MKTTAKVTAVPCFDKRDDMLEIGPRRSVVLVQLRRVTQVGSRCNGTHSENDRFVVYYNLSLLTVAQHTVPSSWRDP
jgi:hypothetical protein